MIFSAFWRFGWLQCANFRSAAFALDYFDQRAKIIFTDIQNDVSSQKSLFQSILFVNSPTARPQVGNRFWVLKTTLMYLPHYARPPKRASEGYPKAVNWRVRKNAAR